MSFFGSSPSPPPPVPVPTRADPAIEEARRREVVASGKLKGAGANLLTGSPYGDMSTPSAAKKALTGQ